MKIAPQKFTGNTNAYLPLEEIKQKYKFESMPDVKTYLEKYQ